MFYVFSIASLYTTGQYEIIILQYFHYGVRQGGIISPKLFQYIDDLCNLLTISGIGCFLNKVFFNRVFYSGDLCLLKP